MAVDYTLTASPQSLEILAVTLTPAAEPSAWVLQGPEGTLPVITALAVTDTEWVLLVGQMVPGNSYTLAAVGPDEGASFSVPAEPPWIDYTKWPLPFSMKLLESFLFTSAKQLQLLNGRPSTNLTHNYTVGDNFIRVRSTLGFLQSGTFDMHGQTWAYTSKTPTAFLGLKADWMLDNIPAQTVVISRGFQADPPTYTPGITNTTAYNE